MVEFALLISSIKRVEYQRYSLDHVGSQVYLPILAAACRSSGDPARVHYGMMLPPSGGKWQIWPATESGQKPSHFSSHVLWSMTTSVAIRPTRQFRGYHSSCRKIGWDGSAWTVRYTLNQCYFLHSLQRREISEPNFITPPFAKRSAYQYPVSKIIRLATTTPCSEKLGGKNTIESKYSIFSLLKITLADYFHVSSRRSWRPSLSAPNTAWQKQHHDIHADAEFGDLEFCVNIIQLAATISETCEKQGSLNILCLGMTIAKHCLLDELGSWAKKLPERQFPEERRLRTLNSLTPAID